MFLSKMLAIFFFHKFEVYMRYVKGMKQICKIGDTICRDHCDQRSE